jgi:hypothetical protein
VRACPDFPAHISQGSRGLLFSHNSNSNEGDTSATRLDHRHPLSPRAA